MPRRSKYDPERMEKSIALVDGLEQPTPRYREARIETGFTQANVAEILGVSDGSVCLWENGQKAPTIMHLVKLSALYGKPIDYLVGM